MPRHVPRSIDATAVIGGRGPDALHAVAFALHGEGRAWHAPRRAVAGGDAYPIADLRASIDGRRLCETGFVVLDAAAFRRFARTGAALVLEGRRRGVTARVPAARFGEALARAAAFA